VRLPFLKYFQLLSGKTVRSSGFHAEFLHIGKVKMPAYDSKQPVQLAGGQGGRRTSAKIYRSELLPGKAGRSEADLLLQGFQISLHIFRVFLDGIGGKGTVEAGARTKGDADIEAVAVPVIRLPKQLC